MVSSLCLRTKIFEMNTDRENTRDKKKDLPGRKVWYYLFIKASQFFRSDSSKTALSSLLSVGPAAFDPLLYANHSRKSLGTFNQNSIKGAETPQKGHSSARPIPRDPGISLCTNDRQVSWLSGHHSAAPSHFRNGIMRRCYPVHSDEIVQDLHLFPFYPLNRNCGTEAPVILRIQFFYIVAQFR